MPASPTAAQSASSRANGALSRGPLTDEGKARSALNGTRHNLNGPFRLLSGEDADAFGRLRADLAARHAPDGEAEDHWVDEIARCQWRQRRLFALEDAAMTAPLADGDADPRLPSLATLARYRARLERDLRLARAQLDEAKARRPRLAARHAGATADQLRWLPARAEAGASPGTADPGAAEPEPAARAVAPAAATAAADPDGAGKPEPEPAADARGPNRAQRRRLAALARRRARGAAA